MSNTVNRVDVLYDGETLITIINEGLVTLSCNGKVTKTDIVIENVIDES